QFVSAFQASPSGRLFGFQHPIRRARGPGYGTRLPPVPAELHIQFPRTFSARARSVWGVKQAGPGTINYAVQHASYCSEKTFLFLDPEIEFRGRPDGAPVPHPDQVMAMGTFAQELFLKCGYAPDQVKTTGSPRYDRIRTNDL